MESFWIKESHRLAENKTDFILITITDIYGSTPRTVGSKMLVSKEEQYGSIGGGKLEWEATKVAREMLKKKQQQKQHVYSLGASLGQCCGGKVSLLLEGFFFNNTKIALFGAGHIAKALTPFLQNLNYDITVVESRKNFLENFPFSVKKIFSSNPAEEVDCFLAQSYYLIMTHEHRLDQQIAEEVLKRKDFAYLGIVGSEKKSQRFKRIFSQKGYPDTLIKQIFCPIGLPLGKTKKPVEIAVSIIAQLVKTENEKKK